MLLTKASPLSFTVRLVNTHLLLINHCQHDYEFVNDARKKVDAEMESLISDVNQKLNIFKHNLDQIKKVETAA